MSEMDKTATAIFFKRLWANDIPNAQNHFVDLFTKWVNAHGHEVLTTEMGLDELDLTNATSGTKVFVAYLKLLVAIFAASVENVDKHLDELALLRPDTVFVNMTLFATRDLCVEMNRAQ